MAAGAPRKRYKDDFEFGDVLGEGSFGQVRRAVELENGRVCAIKCLSKEHVARENKIKYVTTERDLLDLCKHPNVVKLYYTFTDPANLYFVMELAGNGELLTWMRRLGRLDLDTARFIIAELVVALEFLHSKDVIHRDLKPENILLDDSFHVKITDFGTAKRLTAEDAEESEDPGEDPADAGAATKMRSNSFLGTAEYVSPELLSDKYTCKSSDLWGLGCIIYQMLTGHMPFHAATDYLIFQRIQKRDVQYPEDLPQVAHDLLEQMLVLDPDARLGAASYDDLKAHPFFDGIDWHEMWNQEAPDLSLLQPEQELGETVVDDAAGAISRTEKLELQKESVWAQFVADDELILKNGQVMKKKGFSKKKRELILTDKPRLFYVDAKKMLVKGEIPWSAEVKPIVKNTKQFDIDVPGRTYNLTDLAGDPIEWVEAIMELLSVQGAAE